MANLAITIDENPPLSFEGFLFSQPEQVKKHLCESHTFHLTDGKTSYARFVLYVSGKEGKSPFRAPFGSIEFDPSLEYEQLVRLVDSIDAFCRDKKLSKLSIVSYPFCYGSLNSAMLTYALVNSGFSIATTDLNFHLDTGNSTFEDGLHVSESRRLRKCAKENFQAQLDLHPDIEEMYFLIKRNREEKGFPLSMKSEELKILMDTYPENYFAFTMRNKEKLIACSIGVKVSSNILYYFLPATDAAYSNYSPIVLVLKTMFDYCKANNYSCLDLGIATADGVANPGLIKFKQHLGAKPSLKLTFVKEYTI